MMNLIIALLQVLPPLLRREPLLSLIKVFCKVLQVEYDRLYILLTHTPQMASMEHYLNLQYNLPYSLPNKAALIASKSIIYLTDGVILPNIYLYDEAEGAPPLFIYDEAEGASPIFIYDEAEYNGPTFIVWVPALLGLDLNAVRAQVEIYRPAGKTCAINTY